MLAPNWSKTYIPVLMATHHTIGDLTQKRYTQYVGLTSQGAMEKSRRKKGPQDLQWQEANDKADCHTDWGSKCTVAHEHMFFARMGG
jgi:hypothetical protein